MIAMDVKISKTGTLVMIIISFITAAVPSSVSYKQKQEETLFYGNNSAEIQTIRYEWTIENFSDFIQNQSLTSATFSQWYLKFYPKGYWSIPQDYMPLFVYSALDNKSANVRYGLINAGNEEINAKEFYHHFSKKGKGWGHLNFARRDFVINEQNKLFVNNSLTIFCEIKTNISKQVEQLPSKDDLGTNLAVLLDNELFSDATISAGGKNFTAHKALIPARYLFFKGIVRFAAHNLPEHDLSRHDSPRHHSSRHYSPRIYSPRTYSPRIYSPRIYSPRIYSPRH